MGIGHNIRELRTKQGLTQKDLAEMLHVTYQAVSRWENDDAEPSIDTLRQMCSIFNCTTDELFGLDVKEESTKKEETVEPVKVIEKVIVEEPKKAIAVCEYCKNPIYKTSDLFTVNETKTIRNGKKTETITNKRVLCGGCNEIRLIKEKRAIEDAQKNKANDLIKRRILSFAFGGLAALIFIGFAIYSFAKREASAGCFFLILSLFAYTLIGTLILNNTFVSDLWGEIAQWGFVSFPGIIFSFSIDGFIFLIVMKILFFILGIVLVLAAVAFATLVAGISSIFVYPYAIYKNVKGKE